VIERARPTTDGVSLLDISQVTGADTNMALAVVVGGAGSSEITQQRIRNSLAVAFRGSAPRRWSPRRSPVARSISARTAPTCSALDQPDRS
jgi:hypothetical protein